MRIISMSVGELQENCYIVCEKNNAVVIDPGADAARIENTLRTNDLMLSHILLTHGHYDHIGAVGELKDATGALICIHQEDADMLRYPNKNLSVFFNMNYSTHTADVILSDGQIIETGGMRIRVIHTPGHTPGGVCFEIEDNLFTGDTLFQLSVGRADFPGSSPKALEHSVLDVLGSLEKNYMVYPGHGPSTTLNEEKLHNPFMRKR